MLGFLESILKSGVKTSEFWLSLLALVLPYLANIGSDSVNAWGAAHGWIGGLVVAVYVAARAYVKGQTAKAAGAASAPASVSVTSSGATTATATTKPAPAP